MVNTKLQNSQHDVIGILPAGGVASRIAPLPCSKEIYPIGFQSASQAGLVRPKAVCHYLLEKMKIAGVEKAYVILRPGKWDIPAYLGDGKKIGVNLAYLMMDLPHGVPYTIDQAYPFVKDATVVFGFPDILFQPEQAFADLLQKQKETKANLVIGLFPTDQPQKMDMVDIDHDGKVRRIQIKPVQTDLTYTWIIAVWDSVFTRFLHQHLFRIHDQKELTQSDCSAVDVPELYLGDIFQAAIDNGLCIDHILFPDGNCLDIGTPENLVNSICRQTREMAVCAGIEGKYRKGEKTC